MGQRRSADAANGEDGRQTQSTSDLPWEMITRLSDEERIALRRFLMEYQEKEALHAWIRRCWSTGSRIALTVSALVLAISGLSAGISWIIGHIK